ncbi:MORC family CW-type Zinc finger protein 3-like protein [Plakobranchus ocellatus]|uniref:MORC family CW-type Zinc finger protein 3-like protein n=1 Tax=Plakobranchus ocellatus TaxID=259542 RepID=A0AAV4BP36_9GAST|nr:MORC family CW-type Zinc finger protein 3-like protein [Plakobranchus ocellatus]
MRSFADKMNDYIDIVMGETDTSSGDQPNGIDVQCDRCLKWRRLPDTVDEDALPEKWYCHNNPDINYNRCNIPEETDDEAEVPKIKAVKKKQELQKLQQQISEKEAEKKVCSKT